jgi:hypothetical protein
MLDGEVTEMARDDHAPATRDDDELPSVSIDPDFAISTDADRRRPYLAAFRILFPRAS